MAPPRICTVCFVAVISLGVGFIAVGTLVIPVLPYIQLDVVLSLKELADSQIHDATLSMLKKAGRNQWLMWSLAGAILCVIGGIGLRTSLQLQALAKKDESRDNAYGRPSGAGPIT
jgi:hypothetical protein